MYFNCLLPVVISLSLLESYLCNELYSDKVLNYNAHTFKQKIGSVPHFVNFYAPW